MKNMETAIQQLFIEVENLKKKPHTVRSAVRADEVLSFLAENISTVVRSANYIEQLDLVRSISKKLVEVHDLDELAQHILNGANNLIPFTDGSIGLVNEGVIRFPYAIGKNKVSVMRYEIAVGEGLTGWVVKNRQVANVGDTTKDERYKGQITDTNSELDIPITYGNESLGVINIESSDFHAFSEEDVQLLEILADGAAIAIKNVKFLEQIKARTNIIERLTSTLEYTDVLELILQTIFELVKCTEASVGVVDKSNNEIKFTLARGPSKKEVEEYRISVDKGLTGWVVRNRRPVRVDDVTQDKRYESQITKTRSELDVPMFFSGEVIGLLNAESPNLGAFSEEDQKLLEDMANYAALALRHASIYDDVRKRLNVEQQIRISGETRAAIGDILGNTIHDVNSKVNLIRLDAKEISEYSSDAFIDGKVNKIKKHVEEVFNLVEDFKNRREHHLAGPGSLDVNEIITIAVKEASMPEKIEIVTEFDENMDKSFAGKEWIKKVFLNLINNAVAAMPDGGILTIKSYQQNDKLFVMVKDTGCGIRIEDQPFIFDEGFTKSSKRKGMGFGLWWSRLYLKGVEGNIELAESNQSGTAFLVTLPAFVQDGKL